MYVTVHAYTKYPGVFFFTSSETALDSHSKADSIYKQSKMDRPSVSYCQGQEYGTTWGKACDNPGYCYSPDDGHSLTH